MSDGATTVAAPKCHHLPVEAVADLLGTDLNRGLTGAEARVRREIYGDNELPGQEKVSAWVRFAAQFRNVLVILLLAATGISLTLWVLEQDSALPYEAITIAVIVLLNAAMGYTQETRAEEAVAALRKMAASAATVIREGARLQLPATEIVPGDLMLIEEGDTIPADGRVVQTTALQVAEAALTGESLPVPKSTSPVLSDAAVADRTSMVFSGTTATYGRGRAIVIATGTQTELGRIAGMLTSAPDEGTPLQRELDWVGRLLAGVVVVIAAAMTATILLVQDVRGLDAALEVLILGVALAVAAVPEGLPAVVTAVLAIGVHRMAHHNAIVRRLAAVETLGSADVIASDKTGTLTRNEMTVRVVVTASGRTHFDGTGYEPRGAVQTDGGIRPDGDIRAEVERALSAADRANNAVLQERDGRWLVLGDPTEGALIVAARKADLAGAELESRFRRVGEVPFSSERKLMSTIHTDAHHEGRMVVFSKGAPDVLLALCNRESAGNASRPLDDARRAQILELNEELASNALRTLAVAARELPSNAPERETLDAGVEQELVFLGLIGMMDPPRDEAKVAVQCAQGAGVRPIMITGDHPRTAAVIAMELGITQNNRVITGTQLESMTDQELAREALEVSVFARVNPEHKLRIVRALQFNGGTVAMTGDGVNDAPALKAADIGVAMGITGTDVSKEAADVILTDDNFATIVNAVRQGRAIFSNIRKFLRYLLSSNIGEVLTMFLGVVLASTIGLLPEGGGALVLPLLATQILWINLVTDGAPALALGLDPAHTELMARPPRSRSEHVITIRMWLGILGSAVVMATGTLLVLDWALPGGMFHGTGSLKYGQTMAFTTLVLFQLVNTLNTRSDTRSAFEDILKNRWLWAALGLSLVLQFAVVYLPVLQVAFSTTALSAYDWAVCALVASSVLWVGEAGKWIARHLRREACEKGRRIRLCYAK